MFRNTFQSGFLSILYSIGSKPLQVRASECLGLSAGRCLTVMPARPRLVDGQTPGAQAGCDSRLLACTPRLPTLVDSRDKRRQP